MDMDPANIDPTYAGVFKIFVEKEREGFEQCRSKVEAWVHDRIDNLHADLNEGYKMNGFTAGSLEAYKDVLEYLRTAKSSS